MVGQPLGMFYGLKLDGVFMNQAELDKGPIWNPGAADRSRVGDFRFVDVSGPNGVPDGIIVVQILQLSVIHTRILIMV